MPKVNVGENEPLEKALRRFKKKIEIEGILKTLKARKHYEKPSERKRRKRKWGISHFKEVGIFFNTAISIRNTPFRDSFGRI